MFWRELTPVELAGLAAVAVAAVGMVLALRTPAGREAFALLGLRIADALTRWLEQRLGAKASMSRRMAKMRARRRAG